MGMSKCGFVPLSIVSAEPKKVMDGSPGTRISGSWCWELNSYPLQ